MKNYLIDRKFTVLSKADSSFGSQPKFKKDGYWYKYNHVGYEDIAETMISDLLSCSSINNYVTYEQCLINGKRGCRCEDFLKVDEQLLTFKLLYSNSTGRNLADDVNALETSERFDFIVDFIRTETSLDCSRYLFDNITLDMLTRNPDRHFKNLALIMDASGNFKTAPIFDNGQGLFQNFSITPPDMSIEEKIESCFSCTISASFDRQYSLAKESTSYKPFSINYEKYESILSEYPNSIAKESMIYLLNVYKGIFKEKEIEHTVKRGKSR